MKVVCDEFPKQKKQVFATAKWLRTRRRPEAVALAAPRADHEAGEGVDAQAARLGRVQRPVAAHLCQRKKRLVVLEPQLQAHLILEGPAALGRAYAIGVTRRRVKSKAFLKAQARLGCLGADARGATMLEGLCETCSTRSVL